MRGSIKRCAGEVLAAGNIIVRDSEVERSSRKEENIRGRRRSRTRSRWRRRRRRWSRAEQWPGGAEQGKWGTTGARLGKEDGATVPRGITASVGAGVLGISFIRSLVSKKRRRLAAAGYDLDMSYITDRLLAMSFPAQNMESLVRNPMWQVQKVLELRHESHYKVYNLCVEATYDPALFHGRVELLPFDDNHVPPLALIKLFCESVYHWLSADPRNVAVIHCRAGKGRTGLMVCAYLIYTGMSVEDALQLYADRRTYNNEGVTIASQRRYVGYWGKLLVHTCETLIGPPQVQLPETKCRELRRIRLYDTLSTDRVKFVISQLEENPGQLYKPATEMVQGFCKALKRGYHRTVSPRYYLSFLPRQDDDEGKKPRLVVQMDTEKPVSYMKPCLDHQFDQPLIVSGDVRAVFYDKNGGRLFYICFNTFFISNSILQFSRGDLDKVGRRAKTICGPGFCLELLFGPLEPQVPSPQIRNLEDSFELL